MSGGWFTSISTSWGLFCLTARYRGVSPPPYRRILLENMPGGWLHQLGALLLDCQVQRGQPITYRRILLENMPGGCPLLHQHLHQLGALLLDCQVQRGQPTTL
jgi:hypothetical protein